MNLQVLVAFGVYFSILGIIGFFAYWQSRKSGDFILGKRSINYWVTAISVQASDMSDWLFMGYPALVFTKGLPEAWTAIGLVGGMLVTWQYIAHKLRIETEKYGSRTLSSYFESRFSDTSGLIRLTSAIFCLIFFTFYISSGLVGLGRLFESLLGIDYQIGISIGVMIVFYTLFGGFVSMAWIDFFQGLFLLSMLLLVPVVALAKLGGIGAVSTAAQLKNISLSILPSFTLTAFKDILFLSLGWGLGYIGMPHILTKFMGLDDASKMKRAQYIGLTWQVLALSGAVIVGLVGIAYFPHGLARPELVFVSMVQDLFSPFFAGFILCSVLAAAINLISAQILVSASIITEDFFKRWISPANSEQKMLWLSRASVVALCCFAYVSACTTTQSIYNLVQYAWSGLGCTFGPVLLVALHSKITSRYVALAGIIAGGVTGVLWQHAHTTIPSMIAGYCASFLAMALVAMITKKNVRTLTCIIFAALVTTQVGAMHNHLPVVHLRLPDLSNDQIIGSNVGLRPVRGHGIRLEPELLDNGKLLIHNYGHGGSGISLSWGCAEEVARIVAKSNAGKDVAVIGAGIVGLTTAYVLLEQGYVVHLYASRLPPETISDIAVGIIAQDFQVAFHDVAALERIRYNSKQRLEENINTINPRFQGFRTITKYDFTQSKIQASDVNDLCRVVFGNQEPRLAVRKSGIIVDVPVYLQDLLFQVASMGAEVTITTFSNKEDLAHLPWQTIVNCTGLGAKKLCDDEFVYPIKGHMIYLKPQEGVDYSLLYQDLKLDDKFVSLNVQPDRIIIGGSLEKDPKDENLDSGTCDEILQNIRTFLSGDYLQSMNAKL